MTPQPEELVEGSIDHWKEMIEWAQQRDPREPISVACMKILVGSDWYSGSCPLCRWFLHFGDGECEGCPLHAVFGDCDSPHAMNAWIDVARARDWGEWLEAAEVMLFQLETVLKLLKEEGGKNA